MDDAVQQLEACVQKVERAMSDRYGPVVEARALPEKAENYVKALRLSVYGDSDKAADELVKRFKGLLMERERERADDLRRTRLREVAAELESMRAVLPAMAAAAAVEMGIRARELRAEAEDKTDG